MLDHHFHAMFCELQDIEQGEVSILKKLNLRLWGLNLRVRVPLC